MSVSRYLLAVALVFAVPAAAGAADTAKTAPARPAPAPGMKRFIVVRTFPAGAIDGVDAAAKKKINATNAAHKVTWVESFANAEKTKTYCVYDGPDAQAIRDAAKDNNMPVDELMEVPVLLLPR